MFIDTEEHSGSFEETCRRPRRRVWRAGASFRLAGLAMAAAGLCALAPATASGAPGGATMFVQSAKSGELGGGRLVLGGVSGRVTWVTNAGRSGVVPVRRLHRRLFFPGKPATGTLHIAGQRGGEELAFRLSRPRYNAARHTVAYRAKPVAKRRAARAAGFRRPRRFGAASLSIVGHPTVMGQSVQGGYTCNTSIQNNTNMDLNSTFFSRWDTDEWNDQDPPQVPYTVTAGGGTYAWGSQGGNLRGCSNSGQFTFADQSTITFSITSNFWPGGYGAGCAAPTGIRCTPTSQDRGNAGWIVEQE